MMTITVSNRTELLATLTSAKGETTILLAPGNYGNISPTSNLYNLRFSEKVTIRSANPDNPAVIESMFIRNASNISISDILFENKSFFNRPSSDLITNSGGVKSYDLLRTDNVVNLEITNCRFVGSTIALDVDHPQNGYGSGYGWRAGGVQNATFANNTMTNLYKGTSLVNIDNVAIKENSITEFRSDGFFISGGNQVIIENNTIKNINPFLLPKGAGDHSDFIQLFAMKNSIINANFMDTGRPDAIAQGIFSNSASNMQVTNNIIISRAANGITFSTLENSVIANNLLLAASPYGAQADTPRINFNSNFNNVLLKDNIAYKYGSSLASLVAEGKIISTGNLTAQASDTSAENYYTFDDRLDVDQVGELEARGAFVSIGRVVISLDTLETAGPDLAAFARNPGLGSLGQYPSAFNIMRPEVAAVPDEAVTSEDSTLLIDVLQNDLSGGRQDVLVVESAAILNGFGSVTLEGNLVRYDPGSYYNNLSAGELRHVVVEYTISDGRGGLSSSTVTIAISGMNDAPVAESEISVAPADRKTLIEVLHNDLDPDEGDIIQLVSARIKSGLGTITMTNGVIEYDPGSSYAHLKAGQREAIEIEYEIEDMMGARASAVARIYVSGQDAEPLDPPKSKPLPLLFRTDAIVELENVGREPEADTTLDAGWLFVDGEPSSSMRWEPEQSSSTPVSLAAIMASHSGKFGFNSPSASSSSMDGENPLAGDLFALPLLEESSSASDLPDAEFSTTLEHIFSFNWIGKAHDESVSDRGLQPEPSTLLLGEAEQRMFPIHYPGEDEHQQVEGLQTHRAPALDDFYQFEDAAKGGELQNSVYDYGNISPTMTAPSHFMMLEHFA